DEAPHGRGDAAGVGGRGAHRDRTPRRRAARLTAAPAAPTLLLAPTARVGSSRRGPPSHRPPGGAPMSKPDFREFVRLSREGDLVPVWREFLFDTDTAVTAYAKLVRPPFGFLLESVVGGEKWARYTF